MFVFIDSAVTGCNLALANENTVLAMHQEPITRGHAEFLIPCLQRLMAEADVQSDDLDEIIVSVGPGSFTGLRVGITAAQTMGYASNKPVRGLSSFQTFSAGVQGAGNRLVVVDTKRDDYYVQILDCNHQAVSEAQCLVYESITGLLQSDMVITGDAVDKLAGQIDLSAYRTKQQNMIDLPAVTNAIIDGQFDYMDAQAFYIRDADVSQPKATTR